MGSNGVPSLLLLLLLLLEVLLPELDALDAACMLPYSSSTLLT